MQAHHEWAKKCYFPKGKGKGEKRHQEDILKPSELPYKYHTIPATLRSDTNGFMLRGNSPNKIPNRLLEPNQDFTHASPSQFGVEDR